MRRLYIALTLAAMYPANAFARAGGGSSGFGGGGGGGGGGSSSGGGSGSSGEGGWGGVLFLVLIMIGFLAFSTIAAWRVQRRRKRRVARTITASAEADDDDAWFAHEAVQNDAAQLFREVQAAWDARDRDRLGALVGSDLMVEWGRRLDDFDRKGWHNRVEVRVGPKVEYVGLVNREDDSDDRVCVRVTGLLFDVVEDKQGTRINRNDSSSDDSSFAEFWTLARQGPQWIVVSIEQEAEGAHNLEDPLVPTPWSDTQALHDEAVVEQAEAGAANGDAAGLFSLDFEDDARKAALDLSLVDDRYAPDVLEVAARRALAAWSEAVDGDDAALEAIAEPEAVRQMLYGDDESGRTRLVVRGPQLEGVTILELDGKSEPPSFTVEARVRGRRYVENRDTAALVSGDQDSETTFMQRWRLVLSDAEGTPWRVATSPDRAPASP